MYIKTNKNYQIQKSTCYNHSPLELSIFSYLPMRLVHVTTIDKWELHMSKIVVNWNTTHHNFLLVDFLRYSCWLMRTVPMLGFHSVKVWHLIPKTFDSVGQGWKISNKKVWAWCVHYFVFVVITNVNKLQNCVSFVSTWSSDMRIKITFYMPILV